MAQIQTKWVANQAITAIKLGSGAATSVQPAFADGSGGVTYRSILSTDIPTLNQNTTGTAANITATTNATITTLSALTTASSLSSVGTITSGTWNGAAIAIAHGGTGQTSAASAFAALSPMTTAGDIIFENATPAPARLPIGTTGQVLTVVSGLPAWSTASSGANTALSNLTTTSINQSLIPNANGTLQLGNSGQAFNILFVNSIFDQTGLNAVDVTDRQLNDTSGTLSLDFTARQLVANDGSTVNLNWNTPGTTTVSGTLAGAVGTFSTSVATPSFLLNGTSSGAITMGAGTTVTPYSLTWPSAQGAANTFLKNNGSGALSWSTVTSGTVTSVALADGSTSPIYGISGSPVTGSGTLTFSLNTQTANTVFAGPTTGSAAQPTFRALVAADIPSLSATYVTQSEVGAASGVASLDGGGKIPLSQLPATLMEFQGNWNPNTNTPTLVDGTGVTGYTYWVSAADSGTVAGLTDPSMTNFQIGDLVIYNGTKWVLVTPAAGVTSVNGSQGAVTVNAISQLTGDATAGPASGSQSKALTLATVNSNVGTFGSSTSIPTFTVNAKGLITAASGNAVVAPASTLSGTVLNSTVVTSSLTSVGTITSGTWTGTTIAIANGGTGQTSAAAAYNALSPMTTTGDLEYEVSTGIAARLPIGSTGQVLTVVSGAPAWAAAASTLTVTEDNDTLNSTDITNQYKDLLHAAQGSSATVNSISLNVVGGPEQLKGVDYTVSLTGGVGGVTRITFAGDLATGGNAALVSGDILMIKYAY